MDIAMLRHVFSTRIRELRKDKLNQGEFADSVGISRGAMSYYEQESRTPDIGVLRAICEKYNVSADYLLGLMPDRNHAVSDACKQTGLSPEAVRRLSLMHWLSSKKDHTVEDVIEMFGEEVSSDNLYDIMQLAPFTSITEIINLLIDNDEGLSLLTLLGAIILGSEMECNGEQKLIIKIKSASPHFKVEVPLESLSAALWVNIQEHAHELRRVHKKDTSPSHQIKMV